MDSLTALSLRYQLRPFDLELVVDKPHRSSKQTANGSRIKLQETYRLKSISGTLSPSEISLRLVDAAFDTRAERIAADDEEQQDLEWAAIIAGSKQETPAARSKELEVKKRKLVQAQIIRLIREEREEEKRRQVAVAAGESETEEAEAVDSEEVDWSAPSSSEESRD